MTMRHRDLLKAIGLGGSFRALATPAAVKRPRNILFFICDEFRFDGAHYSGNPFPLTPNLDELARTGVNFARTYCQNPVCTPARTSLLLGRYSHSTGVWGNSQLSYRDQPSFTQLLRGAGYRAACFGKLHVDGRDDLDWDVQKIDDFPFGGNTGGPGANRKQDGRKDDKKKGEGKKGGGGGGEPGGHPASFPDDQHPEVKVARDTGSSCKPIVSSPGSSSARCSGLIRPGSRRRNSGIVLTRQRSRSSNILTTI